MVSSFVLHPILHVLSYIFFNHLFSSLLLLLTYMSVTVFISFSLSPGIGTEDGSAKKEEDFKGKSQRQVQFNPGQTRATWRVRILTDGKYEQAETFQILLSEPVMGVMEFPATATVEILDPNDGRCCYTHDTLH